MHSRYTWIRWRKKEEKNNNNFILNRLGQGSFSSQCRRIRYSAFLLKLKLCLFTETKWQTFCGIPGFYSTSGAVDYMAVIFCAHLVSEKCEVFTTTSTRDIQLCAWPATQLTCSPLLPADFTRQSIPHAWKSKWKGSIGNTKNTAWSGSYNW